MNLIDLKNLIAGGESETLEFKSTTGQLTRAGETLCGLLNGRGGRVLFGVQPNGAMAGQQVADKTLREIAETIRRIEPPAPIEIARVSIPETEREVIVLYAPASDDTRPYAFAGRPYQRIGTTTSAMPQERYQQMMLQRMHSRQRWENAPAEGIEAKDLDAEEILRTVRTGIAAGRLPEATGSTPEDILDRLEIWSHGTLPFGLRVEDLKRDHASRPRNPIIADVFYRRGLVERWGRGTQTIVELCVQAGHPEPEFIEQAGAVGVRFLPSGYIAPHRIAHNLTPRQREILQILAKAPKRPFREIREQLENAPADRTLREDMAHLKRLGLIDSKGFGRGAVWYLVPPGE